MRREPRQPTEGQARTRPERLRGAGAAGAARGPGGGLAHGPAVRSAYEILRAHNGHLGWWPGRTRTEVIVGAILTQNTAWGNVERAIANLRAERLLSMRGLRVVEESRLAAAIRPSGYFRQKARKVKAFVALLDRAFGGRLARMAQEPTERLREALLATWGIGPETADSILLYAFDRPVFVVDAYTLRIAARHGWVPQRTRYTQLQAFFSDRLAPDAELYNDYHAQMVWVGKHHCRTRPRCETCPLSCLLPRRANQRT